MATTVLKQSAEPAPRAAATSTVESIQFLRFVAATGVVLFHSYGAIIRHYPTSNVDFFKHLVGMGESGVHIFFVISGFIMAFTSFRKNSTFSMKNFIVRRLIRIYPIYWICALAYIVYYGAVGNGYDLNVAEAVGSLLLLPGYASMIIGPGWTLSFEVYFYLCFGVLMVLGFSRGLYALTAVFIGSILLRLLVPPHYSWPGLFSNALLLEFLAGTWIAYFFLKNRYGGAKKAIAVVAIAITGFLAGLAIGYDLLPSVLIWGIPSALLIGGFVYWERDGTLPSFLPRFSFLGDSSYVLYLLHILLIDIWLATPLVRLASTPIGAIMLCLLITALCCVAAIIVYNIFERRMLRYLQRAVMKRAQ